MNHKLPKESIMFYCREEELEKLKKRYDNGAFECIIIYGRRRVGKTALINEFCKDKPTVYFSALKATANKNLSALSKQSTYSKNRMPSVSPSTKPLMTR